MCYTRLHLSTKKLRDVLSIKKNDAGEKSSLCFVHMENGFFFGESLLICAMEKQLQARKIILLVQNLSTVICWC